MSNLGTTKVLSAIAHLKEHFASSSRTRDKTGVDPLGDEINEEITKKQLDSLLSHGDPEAAGIIQGAIEEFAQEFALIVRRFLKLKTWKETERLVVGGGLRSSRVGELAIGRTSVILKTDGVAAILAMPLSIASLSRTLTTLSSTANTDATDCMAAHCPIAASLGSIWG